LAEASAVEAQAVARELVALHEQAQVPWAEVGILLRSTGDLDLVLRELREAGVPYAVTRDREYFRRREIVEAAALVRCVLDPGDQLALLTVLRSDTVGVPDAALIPLWRCGYAGTMVGVESPEGRQLERARATIRHAAACVPSGIPGLERLSHWQEALLWVTEAIAVLRRSFAAEPPDVFVERLRALVLPEATAAARYLGRHRRARLESFFVELERLLVDGEGHRAEVARFLRRAVVRGLESREPVALEGAADSVQVMTIHGAKGLDFSHVYVLQLHKSTRGPAVVPPTRVLRRGNTTDYCLLGWRTPGFVDAERRAERVERAERVRLLYVAMTRAKRRLVLAGRWPEAPGPADPLLAKTMLDLVLHRGVGRPMFEAASPSPARSWDGEVQWVLAARAHQEALTVTQPQAGESASPARVRRDAEQLHRERLVAEVRMARPMAGAASNEGHRPRDPADEEEELGRAGVRSQSEVAAVVGTALHRVLELLDLEGDLAAQMERLGTEELQRVQAVLPTDQLLEARERLEAILGVMVGGRCLRRLAEIANHVVARELPAVMPPEGDSGPVGFVAARIDLVYRDPSDGALVVADYKTDMVSGRAATAQRAQSYRGQLELYARAVQEGLRLTSPPAMELWFLAADRIVRL